MKIWLQPIRKMIDPNLLIHNNKVFATHLQSGQTASYKSKSLADMAIRFLKPQTYQKHQTQLADIHDKVTSAAPNEQPLQGYQSLFQALVAGGYQSQIGKFHLHDATSQLTKRYQGNLALLNQEGQNGLVRWSKNGHLKFNTEYIKAQEIIELFKEVGFDPVRLEDAFLNQDELKGKVEELARIELNMAQFLTDEQKQSLKEFVYHCQSQPNTPPPYTTATCLPIDKTNITNCNMGAKSLYDDYQGTLRQLVRMGDEKQVNSYLLQKKSARQNQSTDFAGALGMLGKDPLPGFIRVSAHGNLKLNGDYVQAQQRLEVLKNFGFDQQRLPTLLAGNIPLKTKMLVLAKSELRQQVEPLDSGARASLEQFVQYYSNPQQPTIASAPPIKN